MLRNIQRAVSARTISAVTDSPKKWPGTNGPEQAKTEIRYVSMLRQLQEIPQPITGPPLPAISAQHDPQRPQNPRTNYCRLFHHQPPLSPNSLAQSSNCFSPCLLTLGLMLMRLASKSSNWIGLISSMDICSSASPRLRSGPIAASFAKAVMSEPENPTRRSLVSVFHV